MPTPLTFLRSSFLAGFGRSLVRSWVLVVVIAVGFGAVRALQIWHLWPAELAPTGADLGSVFWQGLRFDLKAAAVIGIAGIWLWPWLSQTQHQRLSVFIFGALMLLSAINVHYIAFYKTPIDDLIFGFVEDDTAAILSTIWNDFPVMWSLALVALSVAALSKMHRRLMLATESRLFPWRYSRGAATLWMVLAILALVLCIKGTWRAMALQKQHTAVTTSAFLNDMVPNGGMALKFAWDTRRKSHHGAHPYSGLRALGFETPMHAAKELGWPSGHEPDVASTLFESPQKAPAGLRSTFVVLMESWSAEPLRYQHQTFDVAGRLLGVLPQACHFRNFDSAQNGTYPSLEALLYATPITPLARASAGSKPIPWSVPQIYRSMGYRTIFVTSGRSGWRDLNKSLLLHGFDEVVDASHLQKQFPEAKVGIWGVWDHYLFRYLKALSDRASEQPLFVFALTVSNHPPYDLPQDYVPANLDTLKWVGESNDPHFQKSLQTYRYSTDLLGDFVAYASRAPLAPLIAATGDHNLRTFGSYATADRRALKWQVPFMIWNAGKQCPASGLQQPASHGDLFPTLMPLSGIQGGVRSGRNLFEKTPPQKTFALRFNGEARSQAGEWQLGKPDSWRCTTPDAPPLACRFDPDLDVRARAQLALLDWQARRFGLGISAP